MAEKYEKKTIKGQQKFVVGIDEAGRGPLAGPVSVTAVLMTEKQYKKFKRSKIVKNLRDSKKLSEKQREEWYAQILKWKKEGMLDFSNSLVGAKQIDKRGIAVVIRSAISRLLKNVEAPDTSTKVLLDGSLKAPSNYINQETIIKGDEKEPIISLASIVAKVRRDSLMVKIANKYPKYSFEIHKGYGTLLHRTLIKKHGQCEIHRKSYCRNISAN